MKNQMPDRWSIALHATNRYYENSELKVTRERLTEDSDVVKIEIGGSQISIHFDRDAYLDEFPFRSARSASSS